MPNIGFLHIEGEDIGVRVDVDSCKTVGDAVEYDTYNRVGEKTGRTRIASKRITRIDLPS